LKQREISIKKLMNESSELRKRIAELEISEGEMKKSIERLAESEEKYRNIVEMSPNGIVTVDLKGRITACNKAFFDETGYSREEIIGKKFTRLPHLLKKDVQRYLKVFSSLLKGKIPRPLRFDWIQKNGAARTSEAYISLIKKRGKISGILAIARDITEQKKTEDFLRINEEKYSNLFHHSNDAIIIHDEDGNILDVNKRALDLFGFRKSEILKRKVPDLYPRSEPETSEKAFQTIKKDGFVNFEYLFIKKNKEVFPAEVSSSLFTVGTKRLIQGVVRDITERKKAEEALRESEMKYRVLFEFANVAVFIMNLNGEQVMINKRAAEMLGSTIEELRNKSFKDIIASSEFKDARSKLKGLLAGKSYKPYERIVRCKDGREFPVEITATLIRNMEGKPLFIQSVVRDITEHKKAQEVLKESKEMYRTLIETSPDAVTATDLEGNITYASRRTVQLHGFKSAEEMIGKNALDLIAPEDRKRAANNLKRTLEEGTVRELEYTLLRKDGTRFVGELNASLVKDVRGEPKALIGITRDITERKKAQQVLSESEKKFRSLVENANDAIYIITHEGFQYVNTAFERLTGYTSKEVCEKTFNFWNIIHPDDVKMIRGRETARREGKEVPSRYEFRIIAKDGAMKTVEPATVGIGEKGEAKVIGILRDVTERKQAEERIKASLREKDVLLREIHHRVKNNMQIISSLLRLQSRLVRDGKMVEMFKESQNRIRSMALIHEKLYQTDDLSKINFAEYIRSLTVHLFHTYKVNPNIVRMNAELEEVSLNINKAIPCGLIINELVSNALKHAFPDSKKGEIRIELSSNRQNRTKLVVSDDGRGLPEKLDIHEPKTLGLQLVNDLVKQIDGTIRLDTTQGTAFYISFLA
jgi:PAS domain S-box-containing protein